MANWIRICRFGPLGGWLHWRKAVALNRLAPGAVVSSAGRVLGGRAIDAIPELFARPEEQAALGLHGDDLSGLRVTALISWVILDVEGAKTANLDVLAPAERVLHGLEDGFNRG